MSQFWLWPHKTKFILLHTSGNMKKPKGKKNVNLSKRFRKEWVFLGLTGISLGLCPWEIPQKNPASPWKTPTVRPLLLGLTQHQHTQVFLNGFSEVLGNLLQTGDCLPKVGKSSCEVLYH